MKKKMLITILALTITGAFATTNPIKKTINVKESTIIWTGKKVLGSHTGTIQLKSGFLEMDNSLLVGGEFTVDMSSLEVTDLEAGKGKEKLEGHLKSPDFFDTSNHPLATFVITHSTKNGDVYDVTGDLTIKETTVEIQITMNVGENQASTAFNVDRTKYGVRYGSPSFFDNLKDNAISDNFELVVDLKF